MSVPCGSLISFENVYGAVGVVCIRLFIPKTEENKSSFLFGAKMG